MIKMEHVSAGYGKQIRIRDIDVRFAKGRMTVIIGPNGSGKSTLMKSVVGLSHVMEGTIRIQGEDVTVLGSKKIARIVSYLSQNRNLPSITAEKMVLHGRFPYLSYPRHYSDMDKQFVRAAMERLGIWELRKKEVARLSGGERQKVYLAMALAGNTDVLILDEPTTYLDVCYQIEFMKLLDELRREGKTVVVILHDLNAALQHADQILVMQDGRIVGAGTPDEVFESRILDETFRIRSHCFMDESGENHYYFS